MALSILDLRFGDSWIIGVACLGIILLSAWALSRTSNPYPLPPGPRGEPIIGHIRVIPAENPERYFQKLSKEYNSDVIYFKQYRTPVIVLNTAKAAEELLSKRGANYSSRPRFVLFEVMGWGLTLTFLPWGPLFKTHRALLQKNFTQSNIIQYQQRQEQEARQAVRSIIKDPADWESHIRRFASNIVLKIAFGIDLTRDEDSSIQVATGLANRVLAEGGSPGATVIDNFPFLAKFPSWLVRSEALKHARKWGWVIRHLHDTPFSASKRHFESGSLRHDSFVYPLLKQNAENPKIGTLNGLSMADINGAAATIFIAGYDTTNTTVLVGLLAMLLNPAVFKKARDFLDQVIGTNRFPSLSDRDNPALRYIDYLVEEISRWRPLSPLGVPHKSLKDDVYNSMFIPKGSHIYFNAWAMSRDETMYQNPEVFNPDRYIPEDEGGAGEPFLQGPFGFGRRICVGKHLAQASVWIALATLISTMDISNPLGPDGKEVEPEVKFSTGLSSHPAHFGCIFNVRSRKIESMLSSING